MKEPIKHWEYQQALKMLETADDHHTEELNRAIKYIDAFRAGYNYAKHEKTLSPKQ